MPSCSRRQRRNSWRRGLCCHQSRAGVERFAGDGLDAGIEQSGAPQVQHHFRHAAGKENLDGGEVARAVGQGVHQARHLAIDLRPVGGGGPLQFRRKGDGGNVQQQIGGSAKGRVDHHGVLNRGLRQDIRRADLQLVQAQYRPRRTARGVEPNGLARRRQRGVRQRETQRLAHHLRRRRGAEELASASGRGAGAAADVGGVFER